MGMASRVTALVLGFGACGALAEVRTGRWVEVAPGEVIEGNLYAAGQTVNVRGRVTGDVVAAANNVQVLGEVLGDVLAVGANVTVSGGVGGSVRAGAGQVNLSGPVGEDAALAGGQVRISAPAKLAGDLLMGGGRVELGAPVGGDVWVAGGEVALGDAVQGDVHARTGELRLSEGARIGGNLDYQSERAAQLAPGAQVSGSVSREQLPGREARGRLFFLFWIRALIAFFALGLLVTLGFPGFTQRATSALRTTPTKSLGLGAVGLFGTPLAAAAVFVLGLLLGGWWLGLLLLALYAGAVAVCFPVVGIFLGRLLFEALRRPSVHRVVALLAGVVVLTLLIRVPVLGALVALATVLFGLGAMILATLQGRRAAAA